LPHSLEKVLEKMSKDWEGVEFRITEYKDTGTYVMGGADEVQVRGRVKQGGKEGGM
jgi:dynein heavy chain